MVVADGVKNTVLTYTVPEPCKKPENVHVTAETEVLYSTDFKANLTAEGVYDGLLAFVGDGDVSERPEDGRIYSTGGWMGDPDEIGGWPVGIFGTANELSASGLIPDKTYHIYAYPYNSQCIGGPVYAGTPIVIPVRTAVGGPAVEMAGVTANTVRFTFSGIGVRNRHLGWYGASRLPSGRLWLAL